MFTVVVFRITVRMAPLSKEIPYHGIMPRVGPLCRRRIYELTKSRSLDHLVQVRSSLVPRQKRLSSAIDPPMSSSASPLETHLTVVGISDKHAPTGCITWRPLSSRRFRTVPSAEEVLRSACKSCRCVDLLVHQWTGTARQAYAKWLKQYDWKNTWEMWNLRSTQDKFGKMSYVLLFILILQEHSQGYRAKSVHLLFLHPKSNISFVT